MLADLVAEQITESIELICFESSNIFFSFDIYKDEIFLQRMNTAKQLDLK